MSKTKSPVTKNEVSVPVAKAASAASMLGSLMSGTKTVAKTKAKPKRPSVDMSENAQELFRQFVPAKELAEIFSARAESLKGELNDEVFGEWVESMWKTRSQPANPSMSVDGDDGKPDYEGMFVVQEKIKVQIPEPTNPVESVIDLMESVGVARDTAENIINSEIDFSPTVGLRPFTELVSGHYEDRNFIEATADEKAVAQKILEFVTTSLSDEERALVLKQESNMIVKNGFLARVASYVKSLPELKSVFKVLSPVRYPKGVKFGINDTPVKKSERLIEEAKEILGAEVETDD